MIGEPFRSALASAGLVFDGQVISDGRLHRFRAEGDREKNSWYVLHTGPPAAGAFGCWKRGISESWCARNGEMSQAEWIQVRSRWKDADRERERCEAERHAKARKFAEWILERARPITCHDYLRAKAVKVHGDVRRYRAALVVPLRSASSSGTLSIQFISPDGRKRFLTGGRTAGCFFTLADKPTGALVICEGYATGASIHEATGCAVVCAMHAGNLKAVAEALRAKWPDREIIIAGDNDQFTAGNPGVTKAKEAARTIRARLCVPVFKDISNSPTDFNDLARIEGLDTVKAQIESDPKSSDDQVIAWLAELQPLEYERARDEAAKKLGCRSSVLDRLVDAQRPKANGDLQGRAIELAEVEPWPDSVDGKEVLNQMAATFSRFVFLPDGAADALALWCAHAHVFKCFLCSPRLNIRSERKGCGKTTCRDVIGLFVPRPLLTENLSVAVLFRLVEAHSPTIMADEADAWLTDNEELRGLLNSGHRRGGIALRCEGDGNEVRGFRVFSPAVLCGIGALPGTLHDRSIVVRLERARPGEVRESFDSRHVERETELNRKLARWCADNSGRLETHEPTLPSKAFNRTADKWRPLFSIGEIAGGDWPQRTAEAFSKITRQDDEMDAQDLATMLLADTWQIFRQARASRMFSKGIVEGLRAMSDRPWPEVNHGKPISETWLARRLKSFGISTRTLRIGEERAKGYAIADFQEAIDRYLPVPDLNRDTVTNQAGIDGIDFSKRDMLFPCHASETNETPANIGLARCHASNGSGEER